ncbi:MAG: hypothetical protein QW779_06610 [Nitrososphaerales archaeon]
MATYDFFVEKEGKCYVVEATCWPNYYEGNRRTLTQAVINDEVKKEESRSLKKFCDKDFLNKYRFRVSRKDVKPSGKILMWWEVNEKELDRIKDEYGFEEVLSIKGALSDLIGDEKCLKIVEERHKWTEDLFNLLTGSMES